jgi:hypothetical protein
MSQKGREACETPRDKQFEVEPTRDWQDTWQQEVRAKNIHHNRRRNENEMNIKEKRKTLQFATATQRTTLTGNE